MKSHKDLRGKPNSFDAEDLLRKAAKLDPIRKSGREKASFRALPDDEEDDLELLALRKKESVLDYYDDEG